MEDQRLFEWRDGPLVTAMRTGEMFLVDEISLADDSVLERLNRSGCQIIFPHLFIFVLFFYQSFH